MRQREIRSENPSSAVPHKKSALDELCPMKDGIFSLREPPLPVAVVEQVKPGHSLSALGSDSDAEASLSPRQMPSPEPGVERSHQARPRESCWACQSSWDPRPLHRWAIFREAVDPPVSQPRPFPLCSCLSLPLVLILPPVRPHGFPCCRYCAGDRHSEGCCKKARRPILRDRVPGGGHKGRAAGRKCGHQWHLPHCEVSLVPSQPFPVGSSLSPAARRCSGRLHQLRHPWLRCHWGDSEGHQPRAAHGWQHRQLREVCKSRRRDRRPQRFWSCLQHGEMLNKRIRSSPHPPAVSYPPLWLRHVLGVTLSCFLRWIISLVSGPSAPASLVRAITRGTNCRRQIPNLGWAKHSLRLACGLAGVFQSHGLCP